MIYPPNYWQKHYGCKIMPHTISWKTADVKFNYKSFNSESELIAYAKKYLKNYKTTKLLEN